MTSDTQDATNGEQTSRLSVRLSVPAMDSPTRARTVDDRLRQVDGVTGVTLHPTDGSVTVTYDPERTSESAVIEAIGRAGFDPVADTVRRRRRDRGRRSRGTRGWGCECRGCRH